MWILKFKGETWYVSHVNCNVKWSTKETPDSSHTKGAIKIKNCLVSIDEANIATLTEASDLDFETYKSKVKPTLIITPMKKELLQAMENCGITSGPIKMFYGGCSTTFYVTELYKDEDVSMMLLHNKLIRVLKENEMYYQKYVENAFVDFNEDEEDGEGDNSSWSDLYES